MTNKTIILGSVFSVAIISFIATGAMFVEAVPPEKSAKPVIVINDTIPITGTLSAVPKVPAVFGNIIGTFDGCTDDQIVGTSFQTNVDGSGKLDPFLSLGLGDLTPIHRIEVSNDKFMIQGFYNNLYKDCALGLKHTPGVFTLNGSCGLGVDVSLTTNRGTSGTFVGDIACIP